MNQWKTIKRHSIDWRHLRDYERHLRDYGRHLIDHGRHLIDYGRHLIDYGRHLIDYGRHLRDYVWYHSAIQHIDDILMKWKSFFSFRKLQNVTLNQKDAHNWT